ncbi:SRPBCC family protein [Paenarthrobacter sp. DKR-5]|uniref:SRPBCC family protein n=1 Tax=Paenarthrobacter sp. DKR-5 TaxID=2835535 RepID=UPI001BDD37E3|nr:SRPBCC family protein [Paenarthrobacter sp. DKR-5]MBT1001446.1 SRPBCC family protein [Paenarthrobacter sp. DKR-5]
MAHAEYEVLVARDALQVFGYLADGLNNAEWRDSVRSIALRSGAAGSVGAVYSQKVTGASGREVPADYEITVAKPGAELQFKIVAGPIRSTGAYYLSTEGSCTRVRFVLDHQPKGLLWLMSGVIQKAMESEVARLEDLKRILET